MRGDVGLVEEARVAAGQLGGVIYGFNTERANTFGADRHRSAGQALSTERVRYDAFVSIRTR